MMCYSAFIAAMLLYTSGVLSMTINPAASVMLEAAASIIDAAVPAQATNTVEQQESGTCDPSTKRCGDPPEQQDSSSCDPSQMRCEDPFSLKSALSCTGAAYCDAYCVKVMNNAPQTLTSCIGNYDPSYPNKPPVGSLCSCSNGTMIADIATSAMIGIGEATCFVFNEALAMSADLLKVVGNLSKQKQVEWAGKIVETGSTFLARGSKTGKCDNVGCPGHEFTVVDPEKLEEMLDGLNVC